MAEDEMDVATMKSALMLRCVCQTLTWFTGVKDLENAYLLGTYVHSLDTSQAKHLA